MSRSLLQSDELLERSATLFRGAAKLIQTGHLDRALPLLASIDESSLTNHYRTVTFGRMPSPTLTEAGPARLPKNRRMPRPPRSETFERQIFRRDGWRCYWCCAPVIAVAALREMARVAPSVFSYRSTNALCHGLGLCTAVGIDYVLPHERGGSALPDNLVTACRACRKARGDRLIEQHLLDDLRDRAPILGDWDGCEWFGPQPST